MATFQGAKVSKMCGLSASPIPTTPWLFPILVANENDLDMRDIAVSVGKKVVPRHEPDFCAQKGFAGPGGLQRAVICRTLDTIRVQCSLLHHCCKLGQPQVCCSKHQFTIVRIASFPHVLFCILFSLWLVIWLILRFKGNDALLLQWRCDMWCVCGQVHELCPIWVTSAMFWQTQTMLQLHWSHTSLENAIETPMNGFQWVSFCFCFICHWFCLCLSLSIYIYVPLFIFIYIYIHIAYQHAASTDSKKAERK